MIGPGEVLGGSAEQEPKGQPRIYVASLSDYNAGILHGTWLEAAVDVEELYAGISQMLATSPTARPWGEPAEEWAIHDYEGLGDVRLGEYEPIERVAHLAQGIARHGEAFAAWWANDPPTGEPEEGEEAFTDAYQGEWPSMVDYGEQLLEDIGVDLERLGELPELLRAYLTFDIDAWVRDMEIGGDIYTTESSSGGIHIFWNR